MERKHFLSEVGVRLSSSPATSSSSWSEDSSSCQNSISSGENVKAFDVRTRTATIHCYSSYGRLGQLSPLHTISPTSTFATPTQNTSITNSYQDRRFSQTSPDTSVVEQRKDDPACHSQDKLNFWLSSLNFSGYLPLFLSAGYDLPTVVRMTPEDLTAIGIQHPGHRKKIMESITHLDLPDGLPDFVPVSLSEWLMLIGLEFYEPALRGQGFITLESVITISVEDLEDIGFYRLGHQKRLLLAIKKLKEMFQKRQKGSGNEEQDFNEKKRILQPSLLPGGSQHDRFSSFHMPPTENNTEFYSLAPSSSSPYTTYGPQEDLPPPMTESMHFQAAFCEPLFTNPPKITLMLEPSQLPNSASINDSSPPPDLPPPMKPLHTSLFQSSSACSLPLSSSTMSKSHDERAILMKGHGEGMLKMHKTKPVARVAANTRKSGTYSYKDLNGENEKTMCKEDIGNSVYIKRRNTIDELPFQSESGMVENHIDRNNEGNEKSLPYNLTANLTWNRRQKSKIRREKGEEVIKSDSKDLADEKFNSFDRSRSRSTGDVLEDIGSMLSDLTTELDAMIKLESEFN